MQKLTQELKEQIVQALKPLKPKKIVLFGSFAYGKPTKDSDLDICVVENDYLNRWDEKRKIREYLSFLTMPKDILNPKYNEYEFYKNEYGSVYRDIEQNGEVLWSS